MFSWFPWPVCPPPGFLGYFEDVAPNLRILCVRICEFSSATACVLSHVFVPCILSSSQDSMHCTLSLTVCKCTPCQRASFNSTTDSFSWCHDPYTLACKARPSFDRCWTFLSVSLSLSLSLQKKKGIGIYLSDLCSRYKTNRAIGRPIKIWADYINEFFKQVFEENENPIESNNQTNKTWINIVKDRGKWTLPEVAYTMTV